MTEFTQWFTEALRLGQLHGWQSELGGVPVCCDRLIHIPTGMGKATADIRVSRERRGASAADAQQVHSTPDGRP